MTAKELFVTALEIAGYSENEILGISDISNKILSIVNTIYSDLYFAENEGSFNKITDENEILSLSDKAIHNCAVFGIAALIQNILGSSEDFEVFDKIYKHKKNILLRKCEVYEIKDTLVKGSDF